MLIDVPEWRQDVLEEHFDELASLMNRRVRARCSPDLDAIGLARIDARIEAHVDALELAGEAAMPLVEGALASAEPLAYAAAALVIASTDAPAVAHGFAETFATATGPALDGLRASLELRASGQLRSALGAIEAASPLVASAACAVLVAHDSRTSERVARQWLEDEDPQVRRCAWMIEARIARDTRHRLGSIDWRLGLADPDPGARRAALSAAARSGQHWLLDHLRTAAERPRSDAIDEHWLLAVLGDTVDLPRILAICRAKILGPERFRVASACGYAAVVEELVREMHDEAPIHGALAADAFFRITGVRADRPERIPLVELGGEPDELADEVRICDPDAASRAWATLKGRMDSRRWVRGLDADGLAVESLPTTLDLETRWGLQLRAAYRASAANVAWDAERFPFGEPG